MGSILTKLLDKLYAPRTGYAACICGAVRIELHTPGSSYALSEQTSCYCHCKDCVGFVRSCCNSCPTAEKKKELEDTLLHNNASNLITFYKSDVKRVVGQEHIGVCKVRGDWTASCGRIYCTKCHTALGAEAFHIPLVFLYGDLLHEPYPVFHTKTVLYTASAEESTRPYSTELRKAKTLPITFLLHFVRRVFIGFMLGKGKGPAILQNPDYDTLPVGYDTIGKTTTKKES